MQVPGGAVPAFLTKAAKLSFDEASRGFEQCTKNIRSIRTIQGHTFKTNLKRHAELLSSVQMLYHGINENAWRVILVDKHGLVPGANGSGRTENYFSMKPVWNEDVKGPEDVPGYRYDAAVTIIYDAVVAQRSSGCSFKVADSNAVLCREPVPSSCVWPLCGTATCRLSTRPTSTMNRVKS
jgi:RNA:NAD 2'-phosphotransferase (TPT1/KptA family)